MKFIFWMTLEGTDCLFSVNTLFDNIRKPYCCCGHVLVIQAVALMHIVLVACSFCWYCVCCW